MLKKKIVIFVLVLTLSLTLFTGCDLSSFLDNLQDPDTTETPISDAVTALGEANITLKSTANETAPQTITELVASIQNSVVEIEVAESAYATSATNGSGVLFAKSETYFYVVTNHHVIDGYTNFWVKLTNGESYPANLKGSDENTDIAVLTILRGSIDENEYDTVTVPSDDYEVRVGDTAIVIGTPLGVLGGTVTQGIVSALERQVTIDDNTMTLMQTDAAINGGNSGGGMFDVYGQLIGIVNAKSSGLGIEGIGFAIPIKTAVETACEIIKTGRVTGKPGMGITVLTLDTEEKIDDFLAECNLTSTQMYENWNNYFNYTNKSTGLYVYSIENPNCDLKEGDYIVSFKGQSVTAQTQLREILDQCEISETVNVVVKRNGENKNVTVTLVEINS